MPFELFLEIKFSPNKKATFQIHKKKQYPFKTVRTIFKIAYYSSESNQEEKNHLHVLKTQDLIRIEQQTTKNKKQKTPNPFK